MPVLYSLANVTLDPMSIIYSKSDNNVTGEMGIDIVSIAYILRTYVMFAAFIAILGSIITLFFIERSDMITSAKKDIEHKLLIIFIVASSVTFFNILKAFFDYFLFK